MSSQTTINVAVTGTAPLMVGNANTCLMVRDALPELIERVDKKTVVIFESANDALPEEMELLDRKTIKIFKYAHATQNNFEDVRRVSKEIWGGQRSLFLPRPQSGEIGETLDIAFIIHLGLITSGWNPDLIRFETAARKNGYELPGDDGRHVDSKELEKLGLPYILPTSLNVPSAWRKMKKIFPDISLELSYDAGLYFCERRLFASLGVPLLTKSHRMKSGRTVFLHIPEGNTPEAIASARDVTVTYIMSLADDPLLEVVN